MLSLGMCSVMPELAAAPLRKMRSSTDMPSVGGRGAAFRPDIAISALQPQEQTREAGNGSLPQVQRKALAAETEQMRSALQRTALLQAPPGEQPWPGPAASPAAPGGCRQRRETTRGGRVDKSQPRFSRIKSVARHSQGGRARAATRPCRIPRGRPSGCQSRGWGWHRGTSHRSSVRLAQQPGTL